MSEPSCKEDDLVDTGKEEDDLVDTGKEEDDLVDTGNGTGKSDRGNSHVFHNYQWGHTEHAGKFIGFLINKKVVDRESGDEITQFLTKNEAFGTEKFDGTNVGKDSETDELYARRTMIEEGAAVFVKASLAKVREADVVGFRDKLLQAAKVEDVKKVGRLIMYGELMCNPKYYHYAKSGLNETWQVFGAMIEDKSEDRMLFEKLLSAGYAARIRVDDGGNLMKKYIQLLMNREFVETAAQVGITCAAQIGTGTTVAEIVKENKEHMKTGDCEGIIITCRSKEGVWKLVKWKGAHEDQPASNEEVKKATEKLDSTDAVELFGQLEPVKEIFKHLNEVIEETSNNKRWRFLNKRNKKKKKTNPERELEKIEKSKDNAINIAIKSAMTKFDLPEAYAVKGDEGHKQYVEMVTGEVVTDINTNQKMPQGTGDVEMEDVRKKIDNIYIRRTRKQENKDRQTSKDE